MANELANRWRARYPGAYDDLSDEQITTKLLGKPDKLVNFWRGEYGDAYSDMTDEQLVTAIRKKYAPSQQGQASVSLDQAMQSAAAQWGVPIDRMKAILHAETGGIPDAQKGAAVSSSGARGPFQLMPNTAKRFGVTDPSSPSQSADAAARYLSILHSKFGDWDKATLAYHQGEGNVERGAVGPRGRDYLAKVRRYLASAARGVAPYTAAGAAGGLVLGLPGAAAGAGAAALTDLAIALANPALQVAGLKSIPSLKRLTDTALDRLGLERPQTGGEQAVEHIAGGYAGAGTQAQALLGAATKPDGLLARLGADPRLQSIAGALSSGFSDLAKELGLGHVGQFVSGLAGGSLAGLAGAKEFAANRITPNRETQERMLGAISDAEEASPGLTLTVGQAQSGPGKATAAQQLETSLAQSPGKSTEIAIEKAHAEAERLAEALRRNAERLSKSPSMQRAGESVRERIRGVGHDDVRSWRHRSRELESKIYDKADSFIPQGEGIELTGFRQLLKELSTPQHPDFKRTEALVTYGLPKKWAAAISADLKALADREALGGVPVEPAAVKPAEPAADIARTQTREQLASTDRPPAGNVYDFGQAKDRRDIAEEIREAKDLSEAARSLERRAQLQRLSEDIGPRLQTLATLAGKARRIYELPGADRHIPGQVNWALTQFDELARNFHWAVHGDENGPFVDRTPDMAPRASASASAQNVEFMMRSDGQQIEDELRSYLENAQQAHATLRTRSPREKELKRQIDLILNNVEKGQFAAPEGATQRPGLLTVTPRGPAEKSAEALDGVKGVPPALVKGVPPALVKRLSTHLGQLIDSQIMRAQSPENLIRRMYAVLQEDRLGFVSQFGPEAQKAADRARRFTTWQANQSRQFDALLKGSPTGAEVFRGMIGRQDLREGAEEFLRGFRNLKGPERRELAAAYINRLGLERLGEGPEAREYWNLAQFITQYKGLSPQAKKALFGQAPGMLKNMEAIYRTAERISRSSKVFQNPSGTTPARENIAYQLHRGTAPFAAAIELFSGMPWLAALHLGHAYAVPAIKSRITATMMTDPEFVRWLAGRLPTKEPSQLAGALGASLSELARRTDRQETREFAEDARRDIGIPH